jgi:PhoH-like ATPase
MRVLIRTPRDDLLPGGLDGSVDNALLAIALELQEGEPDRPVIIVTKDTNLRIKADALGITAQDFEAGRVPVDAIYTGETEVELDAEQIDLLRREGAVELPAGEFLPNEYAHIRGEGNGSPLLARVDATGMRMHRLRIPGAKELGIRARNKEQHYALDALSDHRLPLATLGGKAGTGKTLLAVAAGLHQLHTRNRYHRLLVTRSIFPVGRDVGYLPGGIENKLGPWMQPIYDNLLLILEQKKGKDAPAHLERLMRDGRISIEPITYIRGRSIAGQFIVVDEAQNLTPLEVKTIVTRVGEDTKLVLTGDIEQIDNPYVDASSNGFIHVVQKFMDSELAAHVELKKGERSRLAELASNRL